uniref:DUF218 domain-containing protein n=1 Tax=Strongyloides venezuelensis TaxID=75913 RepID=A0A0K0EV25_STRVS
MYPGGYIIASSYHLSRVSYLMKRHVGTCVLDQMFKKQTHLFNNNPFIYGECSYKIYYIITYFSYYYCIQENCFEKFILNIYKKIAWKIYILGTNYYWITKKLVKKKKTFIINYN